jgi:hypothetical protein
VFMRPSKPKQVQPLAARSGQAPKPKLRSGEGSTESKEPEEPEERIVFTPSTASTQLASVSASTPLAVPQNVAPLSAQAIKMRTEEAHKKRDKIRFEKAKLASEQAEALLAKQQHAAAADEQMELQRNIKSQEFKTPAQLQSLERRLATSIKRYGDKSLVDPIAVTAAAPEPAPEPAVVAAPAPTAVTAAAPEPEVVPHTAADNNPWVIHTSAPSGDYAGAPKKGKKVKAKAKGASVRAKAGKMMPKMKKKGGNSRRTSKKKTRKTRKTRNTRNTRRTRRTRKTRKTRGTRNT